MKRILVISALSLFILLTGCAAHTSITPLGEGKTNVNVSIGGPFIPVTEPSIPTPYLTAGIDYGYSDNINIDAHLHLTSLFYKVAGLDFGLTYFPIYKSEYLYSLGIQPRLLFLSSLKENVDSRFRIYPVISPSAAWQLGAGLIYTGSDVTIPFNKPDYNDEAASIIFSPFIGYKWDIGKSYNLYTELKVHGANVRSDQTAVDYITFGKYGAVSLLISFGKEL